MVKKDQSKIESYVKMAVEGAVRMYSLGNCKAVVSHPHYSWFEKYIKAVFDMKKIL